MKKYCWIVQYKEGRKWFPVFSELLLNVPWHSTKTEAMENLGWWGKHYDCEVRTKRVTIKEFNKKIRHLYDVEPI